METITTANFRTQIAQKLRSALAGKAIQIQTKEGSVVLISEKTYKQLLNSGKHTSSPHSPKIPGKINGDLECADVELLEYLSLPS